MVESIIKCIVVHGIFCTMRKYALRDDLCTVSVMTLNLSYDFI